MGVLSEIRCTPRLLISVIPAITWQVSNRRDLARLLRGNRGFLQSVQPFRAFGTASEVNAISIARDQAAMLAHAKDGS
jgi:hypothetical protein